MKLYQLLVILLFFSPMRAGQLLDRSYFEKDTEHDYHFLVTQGLQSQKRLELLFDSVINNRLRNIHNAISKLDSLTGTKKKILYGLKLPEFKELIQLQAKGAVAISTTLPLSESMIDGIKDILSPLFNYADVKVVNNMYNKVHMCLSPSDSGAAGSYDIYIQLPEHFVPLEESKILFDLVTSLTKQTFQPIKKDIYKRYYSAVAQIEKSGSCQNKQAQLQVITSIYNRAKTELAYLSTAFLAYKNPEIFEIIKNHHAQHGYIMTKHRRLKDMFRLTPFNIYKCASYMAHLRRVQDELQLVGNNTELQ